MLADRGSPHGRGVPTATGHCWSEGPVRDLLSRLDRLSAAGQFGLFGRAAAHIAGLSGGSFVFCGWSGAGASPSDSPVAVVEGPMASLDDRPRPGREPTITLAAKAWLVSLACRKLSPRTIDDKASRQPCPRAWTGAGTCVPCPFGAGHGVQNPRPGSQAAQGAILLGTARSRLCRKDGRGPVRLSPGENPQGGGRRGEKEAEQSSGDHFLRRKAGATALDPRRSSPRSSAAQ